MLRPMIEFDYDKCTGCASCTQFCGKQVIEMQDGLPIIQEDKLCDGLGICVPLCPFDAISVITKDTDAFDPRALREYHRTRRN